MMFSIRNTRNGHKDKRGEWQVDEGYNPERVEVRAETAEDAARLEPVTSTTRERLIAQAKACGNERFEAVEVAEWRRVGFKKVSGKDGAAPFWVATFIPGRPMQSAELML